MGWPPKNHQQSLLQTVQLAGLPWHLAKYLNTLQGTNPYPTWGKGKSSSKVPFCRDVLVPRRLFQISWAISFISSLISKAKHSKTWDVSLCVGNLRPQVLPRFISKVLNRTPSLSWQLRFYWSFQGGIWVDRTTWKFNKKHWSSSGIHLWKLTWRWKTIHLKMYLPLKMVDFILPILVFGGVCGIDI